MQDGFVKVAAVSPSIRVADVPYNTVGCIEAVVRASEAGAKVIVLPELCVTGKTCGDLFWQEELLHAAEESVFTLAGATARLDALVLVGAPLRVGGCLYNCAVALKDGQVLGVVPQQYVSAANRRHFCVGPEECVAVSLGDRPTFPFGAKQLFACMDQPDLMLAVEVGDDAWEPLSPSVGHTLAGATLVAQLAGRPALVGQADAMRRLVQGQSERLLCAYMAANASWGESTTDNVFSGQALVAERGTLLSQVNPFSTGVAISEIDVACLAAERRRSAAWPDVSSADSAVYDLTWFSLSHEETELTRKVNPYPFIPSAESDRAARCEEILDIQAQALAGRMRSIGSKKAVLGISGGLDSTLALLVTRRTFDILGLNPAGILAITMPGFGTTKRTHNNARQLALALGATSREIAIGNSVRQHFADIGHNENLRNAAYENAQARERTQILMDVANDLGGIVVGTGDLSELALGWATYNGDHMSMYAVNAAIPKTLIRHLVRYIADTCGNAREAKILTDVLDTPVSPELLPANKDGSISQQTEDLVGPYELHDFFAFYLLRYGFSPRKIYRLARIAFEGMYDDAAIASWLSVFYRRFFSQQFKRSCSPDGPAVGSVGLSPRGGLVMPSDASSALWLSEIERLMR